MSDLLVTLIFGVVQGSIFTAVALGLVLVFGVTDILNFAHGVLVTGAAFGLVLLAPEIGIPAAILVTLVGITAVAGAMYLLAFRHTIGEHLQGLGLSLGLLLAIDSFLVYRLSSLPRRGPTFDSSISLPGGAQVATARIVVLVVLLAIAAVVYVLLRHTWIGLALRACGSDGDRFAASSLGLAATKVGFYAFVASGLLAAVAGVAIAFLFPITPTTGQSFLLQGFAVVIVGGAGSVSGAAVASIALGVLQALGSRYIDPAYSDLYAFVLMIAVLLLVPNGIFGKTARRAG